MTITGQINFKTDTKLKTAFMREAKDYYKLPASVLFSKFMELVASRRFEFVIEADDTHPSFYTDQEMVDVDEPIESVISTLERLA